MEAKNTVMTWKQTCECSHNPVQELRERDMCLAQAEISFKAGMKEVVDWINVNQRRALHPTMTSMKEWIGINPRKWRAFQKEVKGG